MVCERKDNNYRNETVEVQVEALEAVLGSEDVEVDLKRILKEARHVQGRFLRLSGSNDMSFLVAEWVKMGNAKEA